MATGFLANDFQLDSGRGDTELASVPASVASLAVDFVPECIFGNPLENKVLKYARAMPGCARLPSLCHGELPMGGGAVQALECEPRRRRIVVWVMRFRATGYEVLGL